MLNEILNRLVSYFFGFVALLGGSWAFLKSLYWCYLTQVNKRTFELSTFIAFFSISISVMTLGYLIVKTTRRS